MREFHGEIPHHGANGVIGVTTDISTDQGVPILMPDRRVVLILQARMGSTRLPGKSMMDCAGAPLVGRIVERLKRCRQLHEIVLATTCKEEDKVLCDLAHTYQVACFQGSENDLVDRYYQAALWQHADVVVRLPADNPVPEPSEIDRIVAFHLQGEFHFSSNLAQVFGNGYPDGIGAEVFDFSSLEMIWKDRADEKKREHLHLNFFDYGTQTPVNPERFRVGTVPCPLEFRRPDLVLDVNTLEQYQFMSALYQALYPVNANFHITDIIRWYDTRYKKR
ncbi:MAG: hypothetical protein HQL95_11930 [Magnetococcales bacterium]|nr:hypothetical protein [Magnetococcales bacterium]